MRTRTIAAATLCALAGTAHAQVIDWDEAAGGTWNDAANWSPMNIPDASGETASIALPGTYTVSLDSSILNLGSLSMTNPDAALGILLGRTLGVDAGIANNGLIVVNTSAGGATTNVIFDDPGSTLTGSGTLRLNGFSTRAQVSTAAGADLAHGANHTIDGFGRIVADMQNDGLIDANVAGQELIILGGPVFNTGTIRATNNGIINIGPFTMQQSASGRLLADGGTVLIGGVNIVGGTVETTAPGLTRIDLNSDFDGVTLVGDTELEIGDTLGITNGLLNNGNLLINNNAGGAVTTLRFNDSTTLGGTGTVVLNGFSTRSRMLTAADQTMTHAATHSIRGFGQIVASMVNNGPITADVDGQDIIISGSDIANTATIAATNNGTLDIDSTVITNTGAGRLLADGGVLELATVTLNGGTVETTATGATIINGASSFDGVTLEGDTTLELGDTLNVTGGITNNGDFLINNNTGGAVTTLRFNDSSTLGGTGTVVLNGFSTRSQILTAADRTMTHAASHAIRGFGRINASIINNGPITANVPSQGIAIDSSTIDNTSTIAAVSGGTLDINGSTINNTGAGKVMVTAGTALFNAVTLNGGSVETDLGGLTRIDGTSFFNGVTLEGTTEVELGDTLGITNDLTNNGVLVINNNAGGAVTVLRFDDQSTLGGTGTVVLNGFSSRAELGGLDGTIVATQGADHTIEGQGRIAVPLTNHGTIAPGFPLSAPIVEMLAVSDITNTDSANYVIDVSGDDSSDFIDTSGAYHADGTLTVEFIDGFDPVTYWGTTIVESDGGVTGRYDTIVAPEPNDPRLIVRARYFPDEIRVGAVCKPDIDFNGTLNFFDITAFITLFNAQDPDADISAPFGAWNFFDIAAYIGQFNAGCPAP